MAWWTWQGLRLDICLLQRRQSDVFLACEGGGEADAGGGLGQIMMGEEGGGSKCKVVLKIKQARVAFLCNGGPLLGTQGLDGGQGSAAGTNVWEGLAAGRGRANPLPRSPPLAPPRR